MRKFTVTLLCSTLLGLGACSSSVASVDEHNCLRALESIVAEGVGTSQRGGASLALDAIDRGLPNECKGSNPDYVAKKSKLLFYSRRFDEAEALIRSQNWRASSDADIIEVAIYLILFERRLGDDLGVAEEMARRRVDLFPSDPDSYFILGNVMMGQRREQEAVGAFEEMISVRRAKGLPENSPFDVNFAPAFHTVGDYSKVVSLFQNAVGELGDDAWIQDDVVLAALSSAAQLREWDLVSAWMSKTESRRPDLASSREYVAFRTWVDSVRPK
jgi:hypothetical protein